MPDAKSWCQRCGCALAALGALTISAFAQTLTTNAPARTTIPDPGNYRGNRGYQRRWEAYRASQAGKRVDLIFIGDSITEDWLWGEGRSVWQTHYADRALNFGQHGDGTQQVLWRLENLDLAGFKPRVAIVLIGTNNYQSKPDNIAAGIKAVLVATARTFPGIKVVLVSILPNKRGYATTQAANAIARTFADDQTIFYLDLAARFTPVGSNWKGLTRDRLHLTTAGYAMWAEALDPLLQSLTP